MVNPQLFQTTRGRQLPKTDSRNHEGVPAYQLSPRQQLAQLAVTGCLNNTFYVDAAQQLDAVLALAQTVDVEFVAKTAICARERGYMKDMPALLAAVLAVRNTALLAQVFDRVIDNGKMLRNFVQILRSGVTGRKSLGTRPKKLVQQWLLGASEHQLLHASIGNQPSLADVVKMVHPKPVEAWRAAWFAWLIGKPYEKDALPPLTAAFERFKQAQREGAGLDTLEVPEVPFQMLTALDLSAHEWAMVARRGSWQMVRQKARRAATRFSGGLPAIRAVFKAPMEMPDKAVGAMPASVKPSNTPAWYAPSAPPPCNTRAMVSYGGSAVGAGDGREAMAAL